VLVNVLLDFFYLAMAFVEVLMSSTMSMVVGTSLLVSLSGGAGVERIDSDLF
jgi:hypothetical protein